MKDQIALDQELQSRIKHLKNYPAYLPHIGKSYNASKCKILIVGESHYMDKNHNNAFPADVWYNQPNVVLSSDVNHGWFNTREVVGSYLKRHYNGTLGRKYGFFKNLNSVYASLGKASNLFEEGAYINYYQRPSQTHGKTIHVHNLDREIAFENLSVLSDVIKPDAVVFASKKAFNDFKKSLRQIGEPFSIDVHQVPHPSSAHWNKTSKYYGVNEDGTYSTGKQKFQRILQTIL